MGAKFLLYKRFSVFKCDIPAMIVWTYGCAVYAKEEKKIEWFAFSGEQQWCCWY